MLRLVGAGYGADALVGNPEAGDGPFCLAQPGELYLVYLPNGGTASLDLNGVTGPLAVRWFDPRHGGALIDGPVGEVTGGGPVALGPPPREPNADWLAVVRRRP